MGRNQTHCHSGNVGQWKANVEELLKNSSGVPLAFALGYALHIMTDALWEESIVARFRALYRLGGRNPAVERQAYIWDMSAFDLMLYQGTSIKDTVWPLLSETEAVGWEGLVSAGQVAAERDRTLQWYEPRLSSVNSMMYITKQELLSFLDMAEYDARTRMKQWLSLVAPTK